MTDVLRLLYYVAGRIYYESIEESGPLQAIDSEWLTVGAGGDTGRGPPRHAAPARRLGVVRPELQRGLLAERC